MDTELARTFLTVVEAGNFISAAERLHVSQSTVSTRIHTLENLLGCVLFVRNKAGTTLTPAGRQFQRHATALVRTVAQARHDVGLPEGFSGTLVIGGRIGLWEEFLLQWLPLMQKATPAISFRAESSLEPEIMQGLIEGRIDIGVMYTPQSRPGLKVEQLFDERLVMVSTSARNAPEPQAGYVYVDWGPEFYARHSASFPNFGGPSLTANIGWLGLQHVMKSGGSGYFPMRIVLPHIAAKRLHLVAGAPEFSVPAYVVYPVDSEREVIASAIDIMHRLASSATKSKTAAKPVKRTKR
ncbi:LysR family transcriptional regulator [Afipia birgiae]|jgi:LysR family transcriptional regulator, flagellar master operon regulator|uniref:LysR family transcriptional regulator n=1 Tax=Afipia birgiae TaxID=151414 RepID=UPI0002E0D830|nr:LysR family transcriptional regulator [Afipia birgiae]MBX9822898.1 LysR family transcriptional regulator [Afipia birgiae]